MRCIRDISTFAMSRTDFNADKMKNKKYHTKNQRSCNKIGTTNTHNRSLCLKLIVLNSSLVKDGPNLLNQIKKILLKCLSI